MTAPGDEELERCQRRVGTTIRGKWHVDRLLGIGGMAAVYAATHKMGRQDAIKILHPHVAVSKELRARFEQEAMAISKLGHPGTVRVLDIDTTDDGRPFMVMELLDGESLGQRAERALPTPTEILEIMDRVLEVLAAAHDLGIVHRDVKLDNLFLARDGRVLVLDFGIARMRQGGQGIQTRTGAMLGTTSYMSPEQIQGRNVDGRADLFAVGACLFRLLTGRRLHDAETDAELLIKMGTLPAPPLASVAPHLDPRVAAFVDRALAFDAAARFPDARAMQAELRGLLGRDGPRSAPTSHGAPGNGAAYVGAPMSVAAVSAPQTLEPTVRPRQVVNQEHTQPRARRIHHRQVVNQEHIRRAPQENTRAADLHAQPRARRIPVGWVVAIGLLGLALPVAIGLTLSSWLSPDPQGSSNADAKSRDDEEDSPDEAPSPATAGVVPLSSGSGGARPAGTNPSAPKGPPATRPPPDKGKGKEKKKKKDDD
jgi:serine/threonine protein kinase